MVGGWVVRKPLQVSDNVAKLLHAGRITYGEALFTQQGQAGTYRPLMWAQLKLAGRLLNGREAEGFVWLLAVQAAAVIVLLAAALGVRDWPGAVAGSIALMVFVGHHAVRGLVLEGYPINHYSLIVLYLITTLWLIRVGPPRLAGVGLPMVAGLAVFTFEGGLAVALIALIAYVARYGNVRRSGALAIGAVLLVYAAAHVHVAGLAPVREMLRPTGLGFQRLEPDALERAFQGHWVPFFAYNVMSALSGVLLSEPRDGVWQLSSAVSSSGGMPGYVVCVLSSVVVSGTIVYAVLTRAVDWRPRADPDSALLWTCAAGIVGTGMLSFAYCKDQIMTPAVALYSVLTYVCVRRLLLIVPVGTLASLVVLTMTLLTGAGLWAFRTAELGCQIRAAAVRDRNDWARASSPGIGADASLADQSMTDRMRRHFVFMQTPQLERMPDTFVCRMPLP